MHRRGGDVIGIVIVRERGGEEAPRRRRRADLRGQSSRDRRAWCGTAGVGFPHGRDQVRGRCWGGSGEGQMSGERDGSQLAASNAMIEITTSSGPSVQR
jgi:hypothetical protein